MLDKLDRSAVSWLVLLSDTVVAGDESMILSGDEVFDEWWDTELVRTIGKLCNFGSKTGLSKVWIKKIMSDSV